MNSSSILEDMCAYMNHCRKLGVGKMVVAGLLITFLRSSRNGRLILDGITLNLVEMLFSPVFLCFSFFVLHWWVSGFYHLLTVYNLSWCILFWLWMCYTTQHGIRAVMFRCSSLPFLFRPSILSHFLFCVLLATTCAPWLCPNTTGTVIYRLSIQIDPWGNPLSKPWEFAWPIATSTWSKMLLGGGVKAT